MMRNLKRLFFVFRYKYFEKYSVRFMRMAWYDGKSVFSCCV